MYERVLRINPNFLNAYNYYGQAFFYIGDFHRAIEQFEKTLAGDPQDSNANNSMGLIFLIQQRFKEAIEFFKTAIKHNLDEESAFDLINWGVALWQQEKEEEAMEILKEGMSLIERAARPENERQGAIEVDIQTLRMLEKKTLQVSDQEEKFSLRKTIKGIKFVLGLLENIKEGK